MATFTSAVVNFDLSTDAAYQALWGAIVDAQLVANGWTYVSQTGDGNPNSTATGSANTYPCFRVYSTSVSGETWYMRLDFGHTATGPAYKMQFGTTVNGSGTIGSQNCTQINPTFNSSVTGTGKTLYLSIATGRFMMHLGLASGGNSFMVGTSVHGGIDGTGALSSGMQHFSFWGNGTYTSQHVPVSGTIVAQQAAWSANFPNTSDMTMGSHIATGHPFLWIETGGLNPTPAVMLAGQTNVTVATTTTVSLYGSTRTFLVTAQAWPANGNNGRMCMLYD